MSMAKTRSNSTTSVVSSASGLSFTSVSSSRAEDMMERLLMQETNTNVHVWSTGNLRINTRDMMLNADDAVDLLAQIRQDTRFQFVEFLHLGEGDEWKASYRLVSPETSP